MKAVEANLSKITYWANEQIMKSVCRKQGRSNGRDTSTNNMFRWQNNVNKVVRNFRVVKKTNCKTVLYKLTLKRIEVEPERTVLYFGRQ